MGRWITRSRDAISWPGGSDECATCPKRSAVITKVVGMVAPSRSARARARASVPSCVSRREPGETAGSASGTTARGRARPNLTIRRGSTRPRRRNRARGAAHQHDEHRVARDLLAQRVLDERDLGLPDRALDVSYRGVHLGVEVALDVDFPTLQAVQQRALRGARAKIALQPGLGGRLD